MAKKIQTIAGPADPSDLSAYADDFRQWEEEMKNPDGDVDRNTSRQLSGLEQKDADGTPSSMIEARQAVQAMASVIEARNSKSRQDKRFDTENVRANNAQNAEIIRRQGQALSAQGQEINRQGAVLNLSLIHI